MRSWTVQNHRMYHLAGVCWLVLGAFAAGISAAAAIPEDSSAAAIKPVLVPDDKGYRIEKPGTITFTQGVVIKGKVEKPQVVIFLPKEKPIYEEPSFNRSFIQDIFKPLPLSPLKEKGKESD